MKKGRDAGFSSKRSGNAGSGPPLPDPDVDESLQILITIFQFSEDKTHATLTIPSVLYFKTIHIQ